jgi:hypothetical protein
VWRPDEAAAVTGMAAFVVAWTVFLVIRARQPG